MHASNSLGSSASSRDAALAAATALHNLLLDKGAQQLVCDLQGIATVTKLLVPNDWLLAARAAGECGVSFWCFTEPALLSFICKHPLRLLKSSDT